LDYNDLNKLQEQPRKLSRAVTGAPIKGSPAAAKEGNRMNNQPSLRTERLILRPFDLSDAPEVQRLAGAFEIADTTLNIPHPYHDGAADTWIATLQPGFEKGTHFTCAITLAEQGILCGGIGLGILPQYARAEMGYWIGMPYWNRGYVTEAARELVRFAFENLSLNRVYAVHFTRNPASGRIMQKIGMTHEGRMRQHIVKWGQFEDLDLYAILKSDWLNR
jgi:[ribosomal protein S5]-alanine N-acetyltransferase